MAYQPTDWEHGDIITGGKLNKIEQELTHVSDNATYGFGGAQLSSDGLTPLSYINTGDPMPSNPKKGDTVFVKDGNDFLIYSYNGEDWVIRIDPDLKNRIDKVLEEANSNTEQAIQENSENINNTINDVTKEQIELALKDADFNNKAQAMADKALSDAKANTQQVAKDTLDSANQNIADAKKSLTDGINKEVSDRASAVSALETKAQGYADTAKKNAIDVATSADGVINKKIDDTASSITSTISQNKKDADGKITTAQSTATQALTGLNSKVDTSTYNAKTGQLTTDVTNVTQTANQAKTDIASIKQTDNSQDARMTSIESDADGTKTTVSNLQKTQNTQSGSISTLQQRADGFDATVAKINNVVNGLGQTNQLMNTEFTPDFQSWTQVSTAYRTTGNTKNGSNVVKVVADDGDYLYQDVAVSAGVVSFSSIMEVDDGLSGSFRFCINFRDSNHNYVSAGGTTWGTNNTGALGYTLQKVENIAVPSGAAYVRINYQFRGTGVARFFQPMLVFSATVGTYVQGNYNNNDALTKVKLTADQASLDLSNYKTDADGRITKAQSDITQTAKDVTTKVSQSDYDKKTGDLSTSVSKAQQTADSAVTTIGNYKTSNDNRVKATETSIAQNTKDITLRATNTDLDSAKKDYNAQIAQVRVDAKSITSQVSDNTDAISAQQITIDGITDTVSKQGTNIDSVTKRVTTAEGTLSTATNNISGLQSSVTQTSNQIKTEITDRTKGDSNTLQSSKDFTTSSITSYDKGVQTQLTQTANGMLAQVESTNMVVNSEFDPLNGTFYRLTNGGSAGSQLAEAWSATQATGFADWPVVNGSRVVSYAVGTWYSSALVSTSAGKAFSASIVAGRSPAPTVSTALDYRIGFWDSSRKLLSTASAGNIIDGTAYKGIQKYVVENKIAPANTAFVSVIIAHSSANATDYITRPSLNTGAKASPYTPTYGTSSSSTVLSLFKDNWAIGITDNISKITSGIVGNASQMSLISKNVTIDSPNTQIKGTAWIQSAMIANGAIGSAQIGDATITSAKIATLDVAKLTGNVSSFIQSNWNGTFGSTQITDTGMTVISKSPKADLSIRSVFDANGLTMYTPKGTTAIRNGETAYISSSNEDVGMMGTVKWAPHPNVDYLMIGLHGYHTTTPGDSSYDQNSEGSNVVYGGDGLGFGISNANGGYDMLMTWDSPLVAGYQGRMSGWHVEDVFTTHLMSYAAGGLKVSSMYSEGERSLHTQGIDINSSSKWFGFVDGSGKVGFGTDQTQDVIVLIKGKSYSMYTMLNKLGMLK
ncbi:hypothetical protein WL797_07925 [Leuconostoc mesenteroides]|uniref:hypothetical protein n=1 Tax=Leuconostoc mesenteroides TaxID=1245 RepID=UPI00311E8541